MGADSSSPTTTMLPRALYGLASLALIVLAGPSMQAAQGEDPADIAKNKVDKWHDLLITSGFSLAYAVGGLMVLWGLGTDERKKEKIIGGCIFLGAGAIVQATVS